MAIVYRYANVNVYRIDIIRIDIIRQREVLVKKVKLAKPTTKNYL